MKNLEESDVTETNALDLADELAEESQELPFIRKKIRYRIVSRQICKIRLSKTTINYFKKFMHFMRRRKTEINTAIKDKKVTVSQNKSIANFGTSPVQTFPLP